MERNGRFCVSSLKCIEDRPCIRRMKEHMQHGRCKKGGEKERERERGGGGGLTVHILHTTNSWFPTLYGTKFTGELPLSIPSTIEHLIRL